MRDYRQIIHELNKHAQLHGDAPYVKMDEGLRNLLMSKFDGSVANVCASILSGGRNQIGRMAAAFGTGHLRTFFNYLQTLIASGNQYEGLKELYDITEKAMELSNKGNEPLDPNPATPGTFEQLMDIPMHPDVKDIKAKYRNMIQKKTS